MHNVNIEMVVTFRISHFIQTITGHEYIASNHGIYLASVFIVSK